MWLACGWLSIKRENDDIGVSDNGKLPMMSLVKSHWQLSVHDIKTLQNALNKNEVQLWLECTPKHWVHYLLVMNQNVPKMHFPSARFFFFFKAKHIIGLTEPDFHFYIYAFSKQKNVNLIAFSCNEHSKLLLFSMVAMRSHRESCCLPG